MKTITKHGGMIMKKNFVGAYLEGTLLRELTSACRKANMSKSQYLRRAISIAVKVDSTTGNEGATPTKKEGVRTWAKIPTEHIRFSLRHGYISFSRGDSAAIVSEGLLYYRITREGKHVFVDLFKEPQPRTKRLQICRKEQSGRKEVRIVNKDVLNRVFGWLSLSEDFTFLHYNTLLNRDGMLILSINKTSDNQ